MKNEEKDSQKTAVDAAEAPQVEFKPVKTPSNNTKLIVVVAVFILLVVTGGAVILFTKSMQPETPPVEVPQTQPVQTQPVAPQPLTLSLDNPADGQLAVENEILVKGKTLPNTTVAIFTENDQVTVDSDAYGVFESTVKLAQGINSLNVTAFSDDGQEKSMAVDIVYDAET